MSPTTLKIVIPVTIAAILGLGTAIISYAGDGLKQETVEIVVKTLAPTTEKLAKIAEQNQADVQALQRKHAKREAHDELMRQLCGDGTIPANDSRCRTLPPPSPVGAGPPQP